MAVSLTKKPLVREYTPEHIRSEEETLPPKQPHGYTPEHIVVEPAPQEQGADIDVYVVQFANSNLLFVGLTSALYILIGHFLPTLLGLAFPDAIEAEECVAVVNAFRILLMWIGFFGVFVSVGSYISNCFLTLLSSKSKGKNCNTHINERKR